MGAAKKFELAPDEVYIQEALKDGRATIQEVSMKALGRPDVAFQARVKHIDMDHVHRLSLIHDQEGKLSPIVVFRAVLGAIVRWIMADGFHRHEVYRRKGERAIRAYVVEVTMDSIEHEARLFAAMCNQVTLLTRTPQDVRRAVEMLFADPECWEWSATRIGNHCGVSGGAVSRYREQYSARNKIGIPDVFFSADGKPRQSRDARVSGATRILPHHGKGFKAHYKGKRVIGESAEAVKSKIEDIKKGESQKRIVLAAPSELRTYLSRRGVVPEVCSLFLPCGGMIGGFKTSSCIVVVAPDPGADSIRLALGDLQLLLFHDGRIDLRRVVVCYIEDHPSNLIGLAKSHGIEFLTPDELVESLKGEEGS